MLNLHDISRLFILFWSEKRDILYVYSEGRRDADWKASLSEQQEQGSLPLTLGDHPTTHRLPQPPASHVGGDAA